MAGGDDLGVGQAELVGVPDATAGGSGKGVEERKAHDATVNCIFIQYSMSHNKQEG
jgi:hypothetical protein